MIGKNDLVLLIDIDDFLVKSSPILQAILDKTTNFKTEVLEMFEQLVRNCRYFVDIVTEECRNAELDNRLPNLDRFIIFDDYVKKINEAIKDEKEINDKSWLYDNPIKAARYYLELAISFKEQFLEERDTFLEIDNMDKGQRKYFNYEAEMAKINEFSEKIYNNRNAFHGINFLCKKEAEILIEEAKKQNKDGVITIPKYGALVSMDGNDIFKKNKINGSINKEELVYEIPLKKIENCLKNENRMIDIVTNSSVYFSPSREIVDYNIIHRRENVNEGAVKLIRRLDRSGKFKEKYFSSHLNGKRENGAKVNLTSDVFPEIVKIVKSYIDSLIKVKGFIGQQFHDEEHNVERRRRSSKILKAAFKLHVDPSQIVLIDDSVANCEDCIKHGGIAILYKPLTDAERITGKIENFGFPRIFDFESDESYEIIMNAVEEHLAELKNKKIKIKK